MDPFSTAAMLDWPFPLASCPCASDAAKAKSSIETVLVTPSILIAYAGDGEATRATPPT
jgi:hypothetical protein